MKPNSDVDGEFVELFERFVSLRYPIAGCIGGKNMVIVANQWGAQLSWMPYIVTPITKHTSPSNSHQKSAPEHI